MLLTVQGLTTNSTSYDPRIVAHTNTDAQGLLKATVVLSFKIITAARRTRTRQAKFYDTSTMIQSLTKPEEGETAAESIQIALAASAPNGNNTLISPLHTPEGSRHGSDEPAAAAAATAGAAAMPAPAAVEPEAPRLMFKGPRWKRTAVAVHCLLFLSGCVIAAAMMWSVEKPHERKHRRALIWNGGYILFVTVVTSWWLGITFGNAAYFAVITFTTVGLGDFAPPFLHHDTTYADVVGQYLLFAASSLLGLVLLALLLKALDELLQKRLSKGIDRVAAGVLAMRRRYSSDGSRGRRRGRRASGGSRDDSRASSSTSA